MASVTAYIEEKDLAAKVRNEALLKGRGKKWGADAEAARNKRQPRKLRERGGGKREAEKRSTFLRAMRLSPPLSPAPSGAFRSF